ncbi:tetratricopeptide repeat-containing sensor histidine kinase [Ichthyenterobacterium magnum]|uniref:histidine kinase n=1 Tax=Ichthyenterobacterium magnum TaxID=1230530 RepID=A0A420DEQ9_9FLAO|nr:histidine kinase dimerization/phosphoacceptor domain -containing protein [Ichthyenterobacterium magnum]RKE90860.1 two-component sensor histidine kinase [Ichthyenterobacterium magnum]
MNKQLTIIITLFCVPIFLCAQNLVSKEIHTHLNWLDNHIKNIKDSTLIYKTAHQTIRLSKTSNNQNALIKSYNHLATYHREYSKLDSAFYYINLVKNFYKKSNQSESLATTYLELKVLHNLKVEYDKSLVFVHKALEIYEASNNQKGIAICYTHICDLLYYEHRYQESVAYCDKAIAIQEKLKVNEDLALSYRYKAANQLFSGADLKDALKNINKAINIYNNSGESGILYMAAINWRGNILKYLERYEEAIVDYQHNIDISKKLGLERYLIPSVANIGHVYLLQEKYSDALPYNLQAIELIKKTGRERNLWENYMHVSDIYSALGNYEKALEYHKLYSVHYDEYRETIIHRLESESQAKYETGKKNATIVFQDEKIAQQEKTKILYISIAALLALGLVHTISSVRTIRKKRKALQILNTELDSKNKQNELLLKEIHHRVKNNLEMVKSLIALQSAQLDDKASKEAMLASQHRVQSMGIIHQKLYQGDNLGSIEMKDYFLNLSEGILDTFNAEDKVKIECAMDNLELDVDTAVPIGLIVNELLTNALKYAFPENNHGNIKISMSKKNNNILTLHVTDNGIGKVKNEKPKGTGFGSQLINLLTQQLNGKMQENNDKGTSISFQFKLKAA